MKFYARQRRMPQVIIVSLIDIFAILLIFVIVTTTFKRIQQPEVTIKLPESKSAVAADGSAEPVVLAISEDEQIFLDDKKISLEELTASVKKLLASNVKVSLAMKADKKVSYGLLIQVLDALKEAGVKGSLSAFTEKK